MAYIISSDVIAGIVTKYGATGKAVRAICATHGWRWTPTGAPAEWYTAWKSWIGDEFARALDKL